MSQLSSQATMFFSGDSSSLTTELFRLQAGYREAGKEAREAAKHAIAGSREAMSALADSYSQQQRYSEAISQTRDRLRELQQAEQARTRTTQEQARDPSMFGGRARREQLEFLSNLPEASAIDTQLAKISQRLAEVAQAESHVSSRIAETMAARAAGAAISEEALTNERVQLVRLADETERLSQQQAQLIARKREASETGGGVMAASLNIDTAAMSEQDRTVAELTAKLRLLELSYRDVQQNIDSHANAAQKGSALASQALREEILIAQQLERQMLEVNAQMNIASGGHRLFAMSAGQSQMAIQQLAFAADDFLTVWGSTGGTQGVIGGLRAAANNMSVVASTINPLLILVPSLATAAITLGYSLYKSADGAKESTKEMEEAKRAAESYRHEIERLRDEIELTTKSEKEIDEARRARSDAEVRVALAKTLTQKSGVVTEKEQELATAKSELAFVEKQPSFQWRIPEFEKVVNVKKEELEKARSERLAAEGKLLEADRLQQEAAKSRNLHALRREMDKVGGAIPGLELPGLGIRFAITPEARRRDKDRLEKQSAAEERKHGGVTRAVNRVKVALEQKERNLERLRDKRQDIDAAVRRGNAGKGPRIHKRAAAARRLAIDDQVGAMADEIRDLRRQIDGLKSPAGGALAQFMLNAVQGMGAPQVIAPVMARNAQME